MDVRVGLGRKLSAEELMLLNCGVGEDSWESLGLQGDPTSPFWRRSVLGVHWKTDAKAEALILWLPHVKCWPHWKRPWCWEELGAGGEGDGRGWDGWVASPTPWTSRWTPGDGDGQGRLACCDSWGRKESDTTEQLNWTENFYLEWLYINRMRK